MDDQMAIDWNAKRDEWTAQAEVRRRLEKEALEANRVTLFDALMRAGIVRVSVGFDGEGDSGQIEEIQAEDENGDVALPDATIEIATVPYGVDEPVRAEVPFAGALETVCYAVLSARFGGWEINDGSYGTFVFDVAPRTVALTHHNRFVDVETSEHTI